MIINKELEGEYVSQYTKNKGVLSKEQKITMYNVLELEREQNLNEIVKGENLEIGFMSMATSIIIVINSLC